MLTIVITAAGNPATFTRILKEEGIIIVHVVPCIELARRAENAGVEGRGVDLILKGIPEKVLEILPLALNIHPLLELT